MSVERDSCDLGRRDFLKSGVAMSGILAASGGLGMSNAWGATKMKSLDPINPDIMYGTTSSIWGNTHDIEFWAKRCGELGLQGIEPYPNAITKYLTPTFDPKGLKKVFDSAGIQFVDCANGAPATPSMDFIDPANTAKTIADHVKFAREFLQPLGADHWKCNMGNRPAGGPTDDQLKRLADTLNEIGRQTIAMGIRTSPHPHLWGPMEREHDFRMVMDNTDPRYVWLTLDTGHNVLGGMDPVKILGDYLPRLSEIHMKDTYAKYIGNTSTPTQEQHRVASLYHNLGGGGVDFPAVWKVLRDKHWKGWAIFDVDGPRKGDDGFDMYGGDDNLKVDDYLAININFIRNVLGVKLPPAGI
jgi:inosose dehydratase